MIGDRLIYSYVNVEAPTVKINYSYSKYWGKSFIESWRYNRSFILSNFESKDLSNVICEKQNNLWEEEYVVSEKLFKHWLAVYKDQSAKIDDAIFLLIKRFEVTRKIYFDYNYEMRPSNRNMYEDFEAYALFGILLGKFFVKTRKYPSLNALLKINDIIIGRLSDIDDELKPLMVLSIQQEVAIIEELVKRKL